MRIILISILLFLTSIAFGQTLKQVNGSYNIVGVSGGGPDYNVTGVFIDFTNTYTVADVDTGHIVWDQAGNQYRITSMVTTMPNIIEAVVNDFYASGAPQLGIGAISHHTDYLDLGLRVSTIPENIKANIITDAFLKIDLGLSGVADTARLNHYLKEVDFSNDTAYFRVFDYWPDTMLYELFYVTGPDWYFSDLRTDEDSVYFDISDRVTGDSVTTHSLPLIAGEQGPVGPQGPIGPQGPVGAEGPAGPEIDWYVKEISISGDSVFLDIYDRAQDTFVNSLFYISSGGYTIYEVDSVFTSDRTADLDGNYFRFTNGVFAVEGGGNSTYTEPSGGYFVFNPDSGAIRAGSRIFGDVGMPLGSINFGEDNEPGEYGVHIGANNRSEEFPPFGRYPSQILIGFGNESGNVPFSFALGESNNIEFFAGGGDEFLPSGAIGWGNLVRGNNGIAIGWNNDINNYSSFAFGGSLRAYNDGEIALGVLNTEYPHPPPSLSARRIFSLGNTKFFAERSNALNVFVGDWTPDGVMSRFHFNPLQSNVYPDYQFKFTGYVQIDSIEGTATRLAGWTSDNVLVELDFDSLPGGAGATYQPAIYADGEVAFDDIWTTTEQWFLELGTETEVELNIDNTFTILENGYYEITFGGIIEACEELMQVDIRIASFNVTTKSFIVLTEEFYASHTFTYYFTENTVLEFEIRNTSEPCTSFLSSGHISIKKVSD